MPVETFPDPSRRFVLTYTAGNDPHFTVWFPTIDEAKRHVKALGKPARIYDRMQDQRGTLYPSGSMRWNA